MGDFAKLLVDFSKFSAVSKERVALRYMVTYVNARQEVFPRDSVPDIVVQIAEMLQIAIFIELMLHFQIIMKSILKNIENCTIKAHFFMISVSLETYMKQTNNVHDRI